SEIPAYSDCDGAIPRRDSRVVAVRGSLAPDRAAATYLELVRQISAGQADQDLRRRLGAAGVPLARSCLRRITTAVLAVDPRRSTGLVDESVHDCCDGPCVVRR